MKSVVKSTMMTPKMKWIFKMILTEKDQVKEPHVPINTLSVP